MYFNYNKRKQFSVLLYFLDWDELCFSVNFIVIMGEKYRI